uniref:SLP adaptor and CSK interacting membrane protein n=1 Tax=Monodelphis domestica TaxID=13616 RepID=A0A5F8GM06_MONDO
MNWWLKHFWILLASTIILVSVTMALVLYCICRRLLRQGKNWKITKSWKHNNKDREEVYENCINGMPVSLPPLPPRNVPSSEAIAHDSQHEDKSQISYSTIMKKRVSIPSYIEPTADYDDVDIPTNLGFHHFENAVSSFLQE